MLKRSQDIELAVKELVQKMADRDIHINLKKLEDQQFVYLIELPEAKTSGLRPRTARNRFGAPYSHLPQDRNL